ncbi:uncharacterized protein IAS62_004401 [Cryptococcus decagattii]|uniref:Uncharacterized protein n=1 Tax=Cryptococcus decagattii TaxID=1859122 RepID=A0ABZ2B0S6_9TREE
MIRQKNSCIVEVRRQTRHGTFNRPTETLVIDRTEERVVAKDSTNRSKCCTTRCTWNSALLHAHDKDLRTSVTNYGVDLQRGVSGRYHIKKILSWTMRPSEKEPMSRS